MDQKIYEALLNGVKVEAKKINNQWFVGGDRPAKGSEVLIKIKSNRFKQNRDAWYLLRGCILRFKYWA
tara:strand:- start:46 stop:249 length:204 start_codon:yes stop_codon:yes gene_type:complete